MCVWALNQSSIGADIARWMASRAVLNTVKIAGYIDDQKLSPWDWLRDEILPLIPLEVESGPEGTVPLVRQLDRRDTSTPSPASMSGRTSQPMDR